MEKMTIKQHRILKGITQEEMAKRVGIHVNTYANYEREPDKMSVGHAKRIAAALGVSPNDIFFAN